MFQARTTLRQYQHAEIPGTEKFFVQVRLGIFQVLKNLLPPHGEAFVMKINFNETVEAPASGRPCHPTVGHKAAINKDLAQLGLCAEGQQNGTRFMLEGCSEVDQNLISSNDMFNFAQVPARDLAYLLVH